MKTTKTIFILTVLLTISLNSSWADTRKDQSDQQAKKIDRLELKETESVLLDNYFQQYEAKKYPETPQACFYLPNGSTVYEGEKQSASDLLQKSAFLFSSGTHEYYVIIE